ncbi:GNAT family N-acetyltransferase [Saccharothrix lopnurensis]|uniref:GNAT family N-acetyltransferase n=1 Tax=Saccharothrix lopnurensis TaxID=1670621 RepID=A0ABW1NY10_9PSEU
MIPQTRPPDLPARVDLTSSGSPSWSGRKVRLREIHPGDRRTLMGFDRDCADRRAPEAGGYRHWGAHRTRTPDPGGDLQFAIEALRSGVLVGSVSTVRSDATSDRFSYGIGIGPRHRRCGYAADAVTVLLALMFGRGYRTCEVGIYGSNFASLILHAGLGFREEKRFLDPNLSQGEFRYLVLMTMTAREFAVLHPDRAEPPDAAARRGRHQRNRRGRHWPSPENT